MEIVKKENTEIENLKEQEQEIFNKKAQMFSEKYKNLCEEFGLEIAIVPIQFTLIPLKK